MSIKLRPYQEAAVLAVRRDWQAGVKDALVVLPTGTGKTQTFLQIADDELREDPDARVLIVAHTEELVSQPIERLDLHWPALAMQAGIVQASRNDVTKRVICATVQSLSVKRLEQILAYGPITHLVVDECHHAVAASYVRVIEQLTLAYPGLRHLGVTATPIRADQRGLVERYKKVSFKYTIKQAIHDGYLCPLKAIGVETGVSLGGVSFRDGDFSREGVASVMDTANVYELVVESYKRWATGRRAIGFFSSVEAAYHAAEAFTAAGITAAACDGTTPKEDRRRILADFKAGKTDVLCNMQLFTEGVDVPEVSCVLYAAPTASQGRYMQAVGRGLRIAPGKDDCLILDFLPNELKRVVMAGDLLGRPRQEKEAEERAQERGVVIEAFAEDGGDGPGIDADPDELVARKLDLLGRGQWRWYFADGWSTLDLGDRGGDGQSKALAIVQAGDEYRLVVDARIGQGEAQPDGRYARYNSAFAVLREGGYEDVLEYANDYADEWASAVLASRNRRWLDDPATPKQLDLLARLEKRALPPGLTKGQAGQRTTYWLLRKGIERRGLHVGRAELLSEVW